MLWLAIKIKLWFDTLMMSETGALINKYILKIHICIYMYVYRYSETKYRVYSYVRVLVLVVESSNH